MFNTKQKALFETENKQRGAAIPSNVGNGFMSAGLKNSAEVLSWNGALKYSTTGDDFVDQMGRSSEFRNHQRQYKDVARDMSILWAINKRMTIAFTLFLRMITRVTQLFDGTKTSTVQRGQGLKHEGLMRMIWLHLNHPDQFWMNIQLFIAVGGWHDVINMLQYDLVYNGWDKKQLDWKKFEALIRLGLGDENHSQLVRKYLPQIKTRNKCKTVEAQADNLIGKWIAEFMRPSTMTKTQGYKNYRLLKSEGTAHQWQQLISQGKHVELDFDSVHGRALSLMVSGKYLENQKLEQRYMDWILEKPTVKFTGYPHELFGQYSDHYGRIMPLKMHQEITLNKQFKQLVDTGKEGVVKGTSLIVVRDTSGSMSSQVPGTNMSCYSVAKALALYFSEMLPDGLFADGWIEFNRKAILHEWKGSTPLEKWRNDTTGVVGDTNFMSVINLICELKSNGVNESEFPTGILCISDSEFNPSMLEMTNVQSAKLRLAQAGFSVEYVSNFQIVLWNLSNTYYSPKQQIKFETHGEDGSENVFYFSGFDGSILAFLTGREVKAQDGGIKESKAPKNAKELFLEAMNQELLNMVEI